MKKCPQCQTSLTLSARFCSNCGAPQAAALAAGSSDTFDWNDKQVMQAFKRFKQRLEERVGAEQSAKRITDFQERLYQDNYRETVDRRLKQWAEQIPQEKDEKTKALRQLKYLIDDLLDVFFVLHTADLNSVAIPETVLAYHSRSLEQIDLSVMASHFLQFEDTDERVYTDFLRMPVKKIRNAGKAFLFPEREEKIWFVCDQSIFGNAKEGFAMTDKALYWKSGLQPPQRVFYHKIFSLRKEKEWLLINELYFNSGESLNTRMIWLLRRLARLFQADL
jgi:hypothetical protein